jgi:hypothetical protein
VSVYVESNIEFDFSRAVRVTEHDKPTGHNNNIWPGVDFCIEEPLEWIWLEVKCWAPGHIAPRRRGGSRWSFLCKMRSNVYAQEMRSKFLGTTAFLAWMHAFPLAPTTFVLLFEPPHPMDSALIGSRITRMRQLVVNRAPWVQPIHVAVLTLHDWNARFPHYPARLLP